MKLNEELFWSFSSIAKGEKKGAFRRKKKIVAAARAARSEKSLFIFTSTVHEPFIVSD